MPRIHVDGRTLELGQADFVAQGGEASVYARDGMAFKLFADPARVPHPARLAALRALAGPGIVAPDADVLDPAGDRVGYRMPFLDGWHPLVKLFPPAYRQRNGLAIRTIGDRVIELRRLVEHAHAHGALIVDLNEVNVLVAPAHDRLALIDVDSWQVAGFQATALAESVRDRHATSFSEGTDWFAFAVISFQLFAGIHPFRGRHPRAKSLDDRMKADLSVFHPDVVVPPMVDLDALPPAWRDWYEAVFAYGERTKPPSTVSATRAGRAPTLPGDAVRVTPLFDLPGSVRAVASWEGRTWAWTAQGLYEGRRRLGPAPPEGTQAFRAGAGIGFAGIDDGRLRVVLGDGTSVPTELAVQELVAHRGLLHARCGDALLEISVRRVAGTAVLTSRVATRIAPRATRLHRGVAVTALFGSVWVSRLGEGTCMQERVQALDGRRVIDAVHTAGLTVLITDHPSGSGFSRHVLGPDGLTSSPTPLPSAELLVLPTGVALIPTVDGLELFLAERPGRGSRRIQVDLPAVLDEVGGRPGFCRDDTVFAVALSR